MKELWHGSHTFFKEFDKKYITELGFHFASNLKTLDDFNIESKKPFYKYKCIIDISNPYDKVIDPRRWDTFRGLKKSGLLDPLIKIGRYTYEDGELLFNNIILEDWDKNKEISSDLRKVWNDVIKFLEYYKFDSIVYNNKYEGNNENLLVEKDKSYIVWDTNLIKNIELYETLPSKIQSFKDILNNKDK